MTRRVSRKSDAERAARGNSLGKSRRMSAGKAPAAKAWRILVSTSLRSRRALVGGPSAPQRPPKPTWMWLSREPAIPSAAVTQAGPASAEAPTLLAAVPGRPPAGKAGTSSRPQAQYCGHPSSRGGDRRDLSWTPRRGPACEAGEPLLLVLAMAVFTQSPNRASILSPLFARLEQTCAKDSPDGASMSVTESTKL